jgi:hypothetical protein
MLASYWQDVFNSDACAHPNFMDMMAITAVDDEGKPVGFDRDSLRGRFTRVFERATSDRQLVRRAMLYLHVTGEVLCHDTDSTARSSELRDRVFLTPQWLVDVMKELVHHDLAAHVEGIDSADVQDAAEVQGSGDSSSLGASSTGGCCLGCGAT